ncbi:MAG: OstA-like protein, partial [Bdellovibrionota bacterium]
MGRVIFHRWRLAGIGLFALVLGFSRPAAAASSSFDIETISDLYHITADRTLLHSREKVKEAFGHVVVSAEGKRLACDYLWVDDNTKDIKARGNVVFVDKQTTVEAAELHFNMNTGFGSIFYGRV